MQRSMGRLTRAAVVMVTCLWVSTGHAAVLYDQSRETGVGYISDSESYGMGATFWGQATADNFSLTTGATVSQITFWGSSENFLFGSPNLENVASFDIQVLDSSFAAVYPTNVALGALNATVIGATSNFNANEYRMEFNTSFFLGAGNYYLHVGAVYVTPGGDGFIWSSNNSAGDGVSAFKPAGFAWANQSNAISNVNYDQAFMITGSPVPEPMTSGLIGLSALAMVRRRLRRR